MTTEPPFRLGRDDESGMAQEPSAAASPVDRLAEAARSAPAPLLAEVERLTRELAEARREIARLVVLVEEDPLCGILNRRGFDRELQRAMSYVWRYGTPAALMLIDLDDFGLINDSRGRTMGDETLKAVSAALSRSLRASDMLARLGGSEFAIILWHAMEEDARQKGEQIMETLPVSCSIGAVRLAGRDPAALLEAAQVALSEHKRNRRAALRQ